MARENTPIERWYLPGVPDGFEVYIKREDLTGCTMSGNKVRIEEENYLSFHNSVFGADI